MSLRSDGGTTQRLSDFERELSQHPPLVNIDSALSRELNRHDDFATLVPSNPAAKHAFHELALRLHDPRFLPHSRRFIHVDEYLDGLSTSPTTSDSEQDDLVPNDSSQKSSVQSFSTIAAEGAPDVQLTGYFRFSLSILPADFRRGWVIGSGRSYLPNLGIDVLLTLDGERDLVKGVHARLFHHRESQVLMLKATLGRQHTTMNADKIDRNGRVVSATSQSVEIGNLTFVLKSELNGGKKVQYAQALHSLLAANPRYISAPIPSSFDPTPSANHYHLGHYSIQTPQAAGTFGTVSAAVDMKTGNVYAVKKLTRTKYNFTTVAQELSIMQRLGDNVQFFSIALASFILTATTGTCLYSPSGPVFGWGSFRYGQSIGK